MHISDQDTQPLPNILAIFYANETFEQRCRRVHAFSQRTGDRYLFVFLEDDKRRRQMLGLPQRTPSRSLSTYQTNMQRK